MLSLFEFFTKETNVKGGGVMQTLPCARTLTFLSNCRTSPIGVNRNTDCIVSGTKIAFLPVFSLKYWDVSKDEEALYLNVSMELIFFELSVQKVVQACI